jgi:hypothetical protein
MSQESAAALLRSHRSVPVLMLRRLCRLAVSMCLATVGAASQAAAVTPLRPLGLARSSVVTDGLRLAAYEPLTGVTRIIDTEGNGSKTIAEPDGCRTAAVGVGQIVWGCDIACPNEARSEYALLYDLNTGVTREGPMSRAPPCSQRHFIDESYAVLGIGRSWLAFESGGYHVTLTLFAPLGGGSSIRVPKDRRVAVDLDAPKGQVRMCAPMRTQDEETSHANEVSDGSRPFAYEPPWGVTTVGGAETSPVGSGFGLLLYHCGRRAKTISRCARNEACRSPTFASRIVTWAVQRRVFALNVVTGHRHAWRYIGQGQIARVAHTGNRLFVSTAESGSAAGRAYSASLKGL